MVGFVLCGIVVSFREGNEMVVVVCDYLMEKYGFIFYQVVVVVGYGMQESGFNLVVVGDNGIVFGVFQWCGNCYINGKWFVVWFGWVWKILEIQLDFFVYELKISESYVGQVLFVFINLEEVVIVLMYFECLVGYIRINLCVGYGYFNWFVFV